MFIIQPKQTADSSIRNHIEDVQNMDQALQNARERLKSLPDPQTIALGKPAARTYAAQLNEAKGAFDASQIQIPKPIKNRSQDKRIAKFNLIVASSGYQSSIASATSILKSDRGFLFYQAATMNALANLLAYDPGFDLSSDDQQELYQRLVAAQGGLDRTMKRLKDVANYENDKNLGQLILLVGQLQEVRQKLSENLDSPDFLLRKQEYIALVQTAQADVIKNRSAFWVPEKNKLVAATNQRHQNLQIHLRLLQSVRD